MTSHKVGGRWALSCDACPETIESEERDFRAAVAEMQTTGWVSFQHQGTWMHHCPDCAERMGTA